MLEREIMQSLKQLAESVEFDAELIRDDFIVHGVSINIDGQSHWAVCIKHNGYAIQTEYHMGAAHRHYARGGKFVLPYGRMSNYQQDQLKRSKPNKPEVLDVLNCLVADAQCVEYSDFADFCAELGYDEDSRKAHSIYQACCDIRAKLNRMFNLDELCELFQDY